VVLIHSYLYPEHERMVADGLRRRLPNVPVVCSSDVNPEVREFERMSTSVISAYVTPRVSAYLADMQARLEAIGVGAPLFVMQSSGLLLPAAEAIAQPASLLESGPAAGALAASQWARMLAAPHALAFDMGGTTAKACLIRDGLPRLTGLFEAAREQRLVPGSGLPVRVASVDLVEIGSGGGSIAQVDQDERLFVGPESAGAQPGPACYGFGGTRPTFTDAALLRERLDPTWPLAGNLHADRALAGRAMASVAGALGIGVDEAADGILQVATERMAGALRVHATERGTDAATCLLVAFGGAAPVCVVDVARRLGVRRVAVPPAAGVFSALGLVGAPVATETARSLPLLLSDVPWEELLRVWDDLRARASARLAAGDAPLDTSWRVDARFLGQFHEISVDVPRAFLTDRDAGSLAEVFRDTYRRQFGHLPDVPEIQCLTWRLRAELVPARDVSVPFAADGAADVAPREAGGLWRRLRGQVPTDGTLAGPGLVYDGFTTLSVDADTVVTRLPDGTLLMTLGDGPEEGHDRV
jgi:N-methylhydantoinase A